MPFLSARPAPRPAPAACRQACKGRAAGLPAKMVSVSTPRRNADDSLRLRRRRERLPRSSTVPTGDRPCVRHGRAPPPSRGQAEAHLLQAGSAFECCMHSKTLRTAQESRKLACKFARRRSGAVGERRLDRKRRPRKRSTARSMRRFSGSSFFRRSAGVPFSANRRARRFRRSEGRAGPRPGVDEVGAPSRFADRRKRKNVRVHHSCFTNSSEIAAS